MASGQGFQGWIYSPSELISNVPFPYMVRFENFEVSPVNEIVSRKGLEPVRYYIGASNAGVDQVKGLISPTYTAEASVDYTLPKIETTTLTLFGDSLVFAGPNASSFHIVPFSVGTDGASKNYEYVAKDLNGSAVEGDERGGYALYQGYPVLFNGRGTYQVYANSLSENLFTRLDNTILPLEDQSIIGAASFENRLVVISLQGYVMWSPVNWNGVDAWDAAAFERLSEDPSETLDYIGSFRGGLIISTRISTTNFGNLYNINSLADATRTITKTSVNSFFLRNGVQIQTDSLVGITPLGVLNVALNQFQITKAEYEESSPIIQYLNEIFYDENIYTYVDAFLDPTTRKGYWVLDYSTDRERETKILTYDYNSKKWSLLLTSLPIQRVFIYYGVVCGAGWIRSGNNLVLGIWAFSDIFKDVDIVPTQVNGSWYWNEEVSIQYKKRLVSGVINVTSVGANEVPGTSKKPIQLLVRSDDFCEYKLGLRQFTEDSWSGDISEYQATQISAQIAPTESWSVGGAGRYGTWDTTKKTHYLHNRHSLPLPNSDMFYQLLFESDSFGDIRISYISRDLGNKT